MLQALDYDKVDALAAEFTNYARTLDNAERIRLAAQVLCIANAVQQTAIIDADDMWHARETTTLFDDVERHDPVDPSYHLHNMLENLADEFDALADTMCENAAEDAAEQAKAATREAALAKLTDEEKAALGVA